MFTLRFRQNNRINTAAPEGYMSVQELQMHSPLSECVWSGRRLLPRTAYNASSGMSLCSNICENELQVGKASSSESILLLAALKRICSSYHKVILLSYQSRQIKWVIFQGQN